MNKRIEGNLINKITNYKIQITNKLQISNYKGSHGLPQDSFKLQTMTALIKSFCGGSRGAVFSKRAPLVILLLVFCMGAWGETKTGFFLSLGHLHYSYKTFTRTEVSNLVGEPSDLFFGVSLYLKNQLEVNLFYNRSTEDFGSDPQTISYDKDGFGLEIGKVIHIHLFKKSNFDVSIEFIGGGYGMLYPFKKINSGRNFAFLEKSDIPGADNLYYQAGFYWSVRLQYLIAKKASIDIGFKSLVPVRSNEFIETRGEEILLIKSFFLIGISF
jgi:hypothetical protein